MVSVELRECNRDNVTRTSERSGGLGEHSTPLNTGIIPRKEGFIIRHLCDFILQPHEGFLAWWILWVQHRY